MSAALMWRRLIRGLRGSIDASTLRLGRFAAASGGVAAVEFAMVLPVMVLMYLGITEVTFGINTDRKITMLSRSLADLTGRAQTVDTTEINNIFGAASAVMAPYNASGAQMVISSIAVLPGPGTTVRGVVCWSEARGTGASPRGDGSAYNVPDGFRTANTSFVLAEVKMPYNPMFGYAVTGTIMLEENTPWPVRNNPEVIRQGKPKCLP
jgi:Flp pilus assembly protein TadG